MKLVIQPGKYVVAVSGGVDSMVLLHMLTQQKASELIVAHYDHGIRDDSAEDRQLVEETAASYGLPFAYEEGELGSNASEAAARSARYDFLERVRVGHNAAAIITAHHQDDLLETAILNLLRGTGRKGLTSLGSGTQIIRPLLAIPKADLISYAKQHGLAWHEDSTNAGDAYARNYVRHQLIPRLSSDTRQQLISVLTQAQTINQDLDADLAALLASLSTENTLDRHLFNELPHGVAREVLASWLRRQGIADFDRKTLERVTIAAKTKAPGARVDVLHDTSLLVTEGQLALRVCER